MFAVDEDDYWESVRVSNEARHTSRCPICEICSDWITDVERIRYEGNFYHIDCWEEWQIDKIKEESVKLQEVNEPYKQHE